jgi:hypothetical protein
MAQNRILGAQKSKIHAQLPATLLSPLPRLSAKSSKGSKVAGSICKMRDITGNTPLQRATQKPNLYDADSGCYLATTATPLRLAGPSGANAIRGRKARHFPSASAYKSISFRFCTCNTLAMLGLSI